MKQAKAIGCSISLCFLTLGCASTPQTRSLLQDFGSLPRQHQISNVPFIAQTENYCGPASLAMVANWAGVEITPEELAPKMFTPGKKGTLQIDYLSAVRRLGLIATTVSNLKDALTEVSHDHPIVVLQNLGSSANPLWHYAVLHGYDLEQEELILHSGKNQNLKMDLSSFERTWKDADYWGLIILPPQKIPETTPLSKILTAASALERAGRNQEANLTYQNILKKWPKSTGAFFGLGNTFFALRKYQQSAKAFENALRLDPKSPAILNNLAETYRKL